MTSLELAKKLKDAGLRWDPKVGDWWYGDCGIKVLSQSKLEKWIEWNKRRKHLVWTHKGMIWIPSLSQLLDEIKKYGYWWYVESDNKIIIGLEKDKTMTMVFLADTPENVAAKALLWILEREKVGGV